LYQSVTKLSRSMTYPNSRANLDPSDYLDLALRLADVFPAVLDFEAGEIAPDLWDEVVGNATCRTGRCDAFARAHAGPRSLAPTLHGPRIVAATLRRGRRTADSVSVVGTAKRRLRSLGIRSAEARRI
jgi:hypothetical protein